MKIERVELERHFRGIDEEEVILSSHAWPRVTIDHKVENGNVPYKVDGDPIKCGRYLLDSGLSEKEVGNLNIKLRRKALVNPFKVFGAEIAGMYNPLFPNDIVIYCDWFLKRLSRDSSTIERIANHSERKLLGGVDRRRLNRGVQTKKLVDYLRAVSPDRSVPFAKGLLENAYQRTLDSVLIHEAKHLLDFKRWSPAVPASFGLKMTAAIGTSVLLNESGLYGLASTGFPLADHVIDKVMYITAFLPVALAEYQIDPLEVRARKVQKQNEGKVEYRNMITITPRS